MRLLIYGAKGWIGTQFTDFLCVQGVKYHQGISRVDNVQEVRKELDQIKPTHVLSMIGRTSGTYKNKLINSIDFLEYPGSLELNIRDNLFAPAILALLCKERQIHFTYLGTGCIFNYSEFHTPTKNGYTENDLPNFNGSSYSVVKGYTDQLMHMFEVLNLRIRMPITAQDHPHNFISKIIRYEKICSISNSMTVLSDFFPIFLDMMQKNITGTFNCTNPGVISHNEILEMYRDIVDPNFSWENFSIKEQDKILASKRSNNYLDTSKIEQYNLSSIHNAIKQILLMWKV